MQGWWPKIETEEAWGAANVLTLLSAVYLLWITADARMLRRGWKRPPAHSGWLTWIRLAS